MRLGRGDYSIIVSDSGHRTDIVRRSDEMGSDFTELEIFYRRTDYDRYSIGQCSV